MIKEKDNISYDISKVVSRRFRRLTQIVSKNMIKEKDNISYDISKVVSRRFRRLTQIVSKK